MEQGKMDGVMVDDRYIHYAWYAKTTDLLTWRNLERAVRVDVPLRLRQQLIPGRDEQVGRLGLQRVKAPLNCMTSCVQLWNIKGTSQQPGRIAGGAGARRTSP